MTTTNISYELLNATQATLFSQSAQRKTYTKEEIRSTLFEGLVIPDDFDGPKKIVLSFIYGLIIICAVIGNITLITVLSSNPKMRTVTNIFMISLGISDLLVAIGNIPFTWYIHMYNNWQMGLGMCKFSMYLKGLTILSSILTLTAISFDRYYAVCKPLVQRYVNNTSKSVLAVAVFWLSAFCLMSPQLVIYRVDPKAIIHGTDDNATIRVVNMCVEYFNSTSYPWVPYTYTFTIYFLLFWIPFTIMAVTYGKVAHRLWIRQPVGQLDEKSARFEAHMRQKKKVLLTLVLIVMCYAICWLPFFTVHVAELFTNVVGRDMIVYLQLFGYTNCALNPLLYMLLNDTFKSYMKEMHKNCLRRNFKKAGTSVELGLMSNTNPTLITQSSMRADSG